MSDDRSAFLVLSRRIAVALERFDAPDRLGLTQLSVVRPVTRRAEPDDPRLPRRQRDRTAASSTTARTGPDRGRRCPATPNVENSNWPRSFQRSQSDAILRDDSRCRSISTSRIVRPSRSSRSTSRKKWHRYRSLWKKRAACKVAVIRAISRDQSPLQDRERGRIQPGRQPGEGLVQRLAAGQLGDHQEAREPPARADLFAGRDDVGDLDPQRPARFQVSPLGGRRANAPRGVERRRQPRNEGEAVMPLEIDRQGPSAVARRMEDDPGRRPALLGVKAIGRSRAISAASKSAGRASR